MYSEDYYNFSMIVISNLIRYASYHNTTEWDAL